MDIEYASPEAIAAVGGKFSNVTGIGSAARASEGRHMATSAKAAGTARRRDADRMRRRGLTISVGSIGGG
jgi:hypothetical protein